MRLSFCSGKFGFGGGTGFAQKVFPQSPLTKHLRAGRKEFACCACLGSTFGISLSK